MTRQELKQQSKSILYRNYEYFFVIFGLSIILQIANSMYSLEAGSSDNLLPFIAMSTSFFQISSTMRAIEVIREGNPNKTLSPMKLIAYAFSNPKYVTGIIGISCLSGLFEFLWFFVLIVPAFVKSYSYSQAIYIYKDHLDRKESCTWLGAITESKQLMSGHKTDLFVLNLSFIGWLLLISISFGLASLYVFPYMGLAKAGFYVNLTKQPSGLTKNKK